MLIINTLISQLLLFISSCGDQYKCTLYKCLQNNFSMANQSIIEKCMNESYRTLQGHTQIILCSTSSSVRPMTAMYAGICIVLAHLLVAGKVGKCLSNIQMTTIWSKYYCFCGPFDGNGNFIVLLI